MIPTCIVLSSTGASKIPFLSSSHYKAESMQILPGPKRHVWLLTFGGNEKKKLMCERAYVYVCAHTYEYVRSSTPCM